MNMALDRRATDAGYYRQRLEELLVIRLQLMNSRRVQAPVLFWRTANFL